MLANERVWVYHAAIDLRKSYRSLRSVVEQELGKDAMCGDAFVFVNRSKALAKVLWWDRTGWCLLLKKLSCGRFRVSSNKKLRTLENQRVFFDGL